jgi:hypothetical protein
MNLGPHVVTPRGTVIEDGGGVLVGTDVDSKNHEWKPGPRVDPTIQPKWRFRSEHHVLAPTIEQLAPGLSVYKLPVTGDSLVLETEDHIAVVVVSRSPDRDAARLPPPMPTQISFAMSEGFRFTQMRVTVTLVAPAPRHATAMIAYRVDDERRTAISWGPVVAGAKQIPVFSSRNMCVPGAPGEDAARAGSHVVVAWVDESGRLSAPSRELVVVPGKMP